VRPLASSAAISTVGRLFFANTPGKIPLLTLSSAFPQVFNTFFVDSAFSSNLSYSVTSTTSLDNSSSGCCSVEEGEEEDLSETAVVKKSSLAIAVPTTRREPPLENAGMAAAAAANGGAPADGGGVYNHRLRVSYPAPERHVSCLGGTRRRPDDGDSAVQEVEDLTNLTKLASVSDDQLLLDKTEPDANATVAARVAPTNAAVRQVRLHPMAASTASSSSTSSTSSNPTSSASAVKMALTSTASSTSSVSSSTTPSSFSEQRRRHSSVPQTTSARAAPSSKQSFYGQHLEPPSATATHIPGVPVSLRLEKSQIDKAFKDKKGVVYHQDFQVHLFLVKPTDQSDAGKLGSSPMCKNTPKGVVVDGCYTPEQSSSEEDTTDSEAVSSTQHLDQPQQQQENQPPAPPPRHHLHHHGQQRHYAQQQQQSEWI